MPDQGTKLFKVIELPQDGQMPSLWMAERKINPMFCVVTGSEEDAIRKGKEHIEFYEKTTGNKVI